MTIENIYTPTLYTSDGSTLGPYIFPWKALNNESVLVDIDGIPLTNTEYVVTRNADQNPNPGGYITLDKAEAAGVEIRIRRDTKATQTLDLPPYTRFPSETNELALDKLTMLSQELDTRVDFSTGDIDALAQQVGENTAALDGKLNLTGGTLTGPLVTTSFIQVNPGSLISGHSALAADAALACVNQHGGAMLDVSNSLAGDAAIFQTDSAAGYEKTHMVFARNGGIDFYYNNVKAARTIEAGFESMGMLKATAPTDNHSCLELIQTSGTPTQNLVTVTTNGALIGGWSTAFRVMSWGPLLDLSASDERTKENISDCPYGLDTILALRPTRHQYKEEFALGQRDFRLGFIAQEASAVCADLHYTVADDRLPDGVRNGVKEASLIPILVKAIQELTARVESLGG